MIAMSKERFTNTTTLFVLRASSDMGTDGSADDTQVNIILTKVSSNS